MPWIALSPNIFHPRGGGQLEDSGTVNGLEVSISRNEDGLVVLEGAGSLPVGATVSSAVDSGTRLLHAALHTAGHLSVSSVNGKAGNTVATAISQQARLDFRPESLTEDFSTPETREDCHQGTPRGARRTHRDGGPVSTTTDSQGVRTVSIAGVNAEPCGGTHVRDRPASKTAGFWKRRSSAVRSRATRRSTPKFREVSGRGRAAGPGVAARR